MTELQRLPPHSYEAEESVLGSLLLDEEAVYKVAAILKPEDFFRERHRWTYESCLNLYDRREPINQVTLAHELAMAERLETIGGQAFLSYLVTAVPTSVFVEHYANIVQTTSVLRRLINAAGQIAALGYEGGPDADAVLDKAEDILFHLRSGRSPQDFVHIREVIDHYLESGGTEDERGGHIPRILTGYERLDRVLGGLHRSDLVILAARPSMGKTSLALGMGYHAAVRQGAHVAVFSLEMGKDQLVERLLSSEAGVDVQRLRLGHLDAKYLTNEEQERMIEATGVLSEAPIWLDDSPILSVTEMRSKARRLHFDVGLDLVVIDYLQLISGGAGFQDNRVQQMSEISRSLKALAREINVPVLALSQLSRAVESRQPHRPMLSDLRESGCLAGDTRIYLPDEGVYRPIAGLVDREGFRVLALNTQTWELEPRRVMKSFETGRKPIYRLVTRLGRTVRATANHKFLTINGWRRLDELSPGLRLALPRSLPSPAEETMSESQLSLLGHLIGDGCTLPRHILQYTTNDETIARTVAALAVEVFGDQVAPRIQRERGWYQVYLPSSRRLTHGIRNPIAAWLDGLGVFGLRSYEKHVPEVVFAQPAAGVGKFLRHLWATDGCVHLSHGASHYAGVYYASSSERLARDVQSLLLRVDVNGRLSMHSQNGKGRPQFHVTVSGKHEIGQFLRVVGVLGELKTAHGEAIVAHLSDRVANTNRDVLPREVWRLHAVPAMQAARITTRQMQAALGNVYCGTTLYKHNLGRERAARLATVVNSGELTRLADSHVYWDEIASIEFDGEDEVYDLTVDDLHNFVANDIIAHNSIEQDADVVMFIYRDDFYFSEDEWDRRFPQKKYPEGIANIMISKHRNGPTGEVDLYFQKKTARFYTLAAPGLTPEAV